MGEYEMNHFWRPQLTEPAHMIASGAIKPEDVVEDDAPPPLSHHQRRILTRRLRGHHPGPDDRRQDPGDRHPGLDRGALPGAAMTTMRTHRVRGGRTDVQGHPGSTVWIPRPACELCAGFGRGKCASGAGRQMPQESQASTSVRTMPQYSTRCGRLPRERHASRATERSQTTARKRRWA